MLITSGNNAHCSDGKIFDLSKDRRATMLLAQQYEDLTLATAEEAAGRKISAQEWSMQTLESSHDSRSHAKKYEDSHFKVAMKTELSPLEQELVKANKAVADQHNPHAGLNREESLALTLSQIVDQNSDSNIDKAELTTHLENVNAKLCVIDTLTKAENLRGDSDEGFRVLLEQTRRSLVVPGADPGPIKQMFKDIDHVLVARKQNTEAGLNQEQLVLKAKMAANEEALQTLSDDSEGVQE